MVEAGMNYWGDLLSLGLCDAIPQEEARTKVRPRDVIPASLDGDAAGRTTGIQPAYSIE
jgi:hypothetical protein